MSEEIYRSANGVLIGERNVVRHEPNLASGGRMTDTDVAEFLERTGSSPENQALRALLQRPRGDQPSSLTFQILDIHAA